MATQDPTQNNTGGGMSVREAGRRGGESVKAKYGSEFYEAIGRKGGEASHRGSAKPAEATQQVQAQQQPTTRAPLVRERDGREQQVPQF